MFSGQNFTNQSNVLHERTDGEQLAEEVESEEVVRSADEVRLDWSIAAISVGTLFLYISQPAVASSAPRAEDTTTTHRTSADSIVRTNTRRDADSWKTKRLQLIEKKYDDGLDEDERAELQALNDRMDEELANRFHDSNEKLDELEQLVSDSEDTEES